MYTKLVVWVLIIIPLCVAVELRVNNVLGNDTSCIPACLTIAQAFANGADTIVIEAGNGTYYLSSTLHINRFGQTLRGVEGETVRLVCLGDGNTAIEAMNGRNATIQGLSVENCFAGIVIRYSVNMTVSNCNFVNNRLHFLAQGVSDLVFENSSISSNGEAELISYNAGVWIEDAAQAKVYNITFFNNVGYVNPLGYAGKAFLYINNCRAVHISACVVENCVNATGLAMEGDMSGSILDRLVFKNNYPYGALSLDGVGNVTITSSLFINNTGMRGAGIATTSVELSVINCSFYSNTVPDQGGAIYTESQLNVTNSSFYNNTANNGGGAILSAGGLTTQLCVFNYNNGIYGGAIFNPSNLSLFYDYGSNYTENNAFHMGGAISSYGNTTIIASTFRSNRGLLGGGIYFNGYSPTIQSYLDLRFCSLGLHTSYDGGGLYIYGAAFYISNCVINSNAASYGGSALTIIVSNGTISSSYIQYNEPTPDARGGDIQLLSGSILEFEHGFLIQNKPQRPPHSPIFYFDNDVSRQNIRVTNTTVNTESLLEFCCGGVPMHSITNAICSMPLCIGACNNSCDCYSDTCNYGRCNVTAIFREDCKESAPCTEARQIVESCCDSGYVFNSTSLMCTDVDECAQPSTANCHYRCINTPGSFRCECESGFIGDGVTCTQDYCANATCSPDAVCKNTNNSQLFTCECLPTFVGNGLNCSDINECAEHTDNCTENALCTNTHGSFSCACKSGFTRDGIYCEDINECTQSSACSPNAKCNNTEGSYMCVCNTGYSGNGSMCNDINECLQSTSCGEHALCINTNGSFFCACGSGFAGDGQVCTSLPSEGERTNKKTSIVAVAVSVPVSVVASGLLVAIVFYFVVKRKRRRSIANYFSDHDEWVIDSTTSALSVLATPTLTNTLPKANNNTNTTTTTNTNSTASATTSTFTGHSEFAQFLNSFKHKMAAIQYNDIEFKRKIGTGSTGKVYEAVYQGDLVAVKVLKVDEEDSGVAGEQVSHFCKELEIMSTIQTQHSVAFYGVVLEPKLCMVMEYCAKGSLYQLLNDAQFAVNWDTVFHFANEITTGVKELHDLQPQILHRDIKSLNFLVNTNLDVKVCDFGLSRWNTESNMSTFQRHRGTFAYCAPEVYNNHLFSTKSDVYSLGIVFWELVTRCIRGHYERPYSELLGQMYDFQIIFQVAKTGLRPKMPETCPAGWEKLIRACIDASSENRPTCAEILLTLKDLHNTL